MAEPAAQRSDRGLRRLPIDPSSALDETIFGRLPQVVIDPATHATAGGEGHQLLDAHIFGAFIGIQPAQKIAILRQFEYSPIDDPRRVRIDYRARIVSQIVELAEGEPFADGTQALDQWRYLRRRETWLQGAVGKQVPRRLSRRFRTNPDRLSHLL